MKELVVACVRVAQKDPHKSVDEQDKEYWRWRDNILINEDILLEKLCFDLRLDPPYKILYDVLLSYGQEENKKLRNAAWSFISDSCLTTLCLLFPSRTIAASALYAAARHSQVALPDDKYSRPWWDAMNVPLSDICKACRYMADVYRNSSAKSAHEPSLYDDATAEMNHESDITRLKNQYTGLKEESDGVVGSITDPARQSSVGQEGQSEGAISGGPQLHYDHGKSFQTIDDNQD